MCYGQWSSKLCCGGPEIVQLNAAAGAVWETLQYVTPVCQLRSGKAAAESVFCQSWNSCIPDVVGSRRLTRYAKCAHPLRNAALLLTDC